MEKRKKLVFATNNAHKLEEARQILGELEIVSLAEIRCHDDIPETADTLEGNALIKARWIHDRYGYDCFADDTGLMVDALEGAPGVRSARYAGEQCNPADNMAKLLKEMEGKDDRKAHFSTVVALISDGEEHCFEGRVDGTIAREPAGSNGFGYDPVFVADETGMRFAEMDSDSKNAISHRGRAMRKLRDFLGLMITVVVMIAGAFDVKAESWRLLQSYDGQMVRMIDTGDYVYMLGASNRYTPPVNGASYLYGQLMRYDKRGDELRMLNSQNLLSGNVVWAIEYNHSKKYLVIAYDDGNVDFLYDNGDVYNVPGLKLANISEGKDVNNISIDEKNGIVYIATDFGYVTIDDEKKEIDISRRLGTEVTAIAAYNGEIWIAANGKLYKGLPREFNMEGFEEVAELQQVRRIYPRGDRGTVVLHGPVLRMGCVFVEPDGEGGYALSTLTSSGATGIEPFNDGLAVTLSSGVDLLYPDGNHKWIVASTADQGSLMSTCDGKDFWISSGREGISLKRPVEGGNWSVLKDRFLPNTSAAYKCPRIVYSPQYGMLVRNYGFDQNFNGTAGTSIDLPDQLSAYKDMNWKRLGTVYTAPDMNGLTLYNPNGISIDPLNENHVYCGSVYGGILRLDLEDVRKSIHFSKIGGDKYADPKATGYAGVFPPSETGDYWSERCLLSEPRFDANNVMWAAQANYSAKVGNDVMKLWYWTPENRLATTSATDVRGLNCIEIPNYLVGNSVNLLPLKVSANRNLIILQGNYNKEGIIIYDHNGTPDDTTDDRMVRVYNISDQDGLNVEFNYSRTTYEDPQTGLIWLNTGSDMITFNPREMFSNPNSVRRIKVARNDGTNLADHLLSGISVNEIISDHKGNKWFATGGAGLVCTAADGRTVLKSYTTENSDIPGDLVYAVALNPDNNSMMLATENGLAEFYPGNSDSGDEDQLRIYPNPVRPEYHGYATIDGLPDGAMVKITDSAGNLVKECGQAISGEVKWDLTNLSYRKVAGGVYFVSATNGNEQDSYSKMGKILVIY